MTKDVSYFGEAPHEMAWKAKPEKSTRERTARALRPAEVSALSRRVPIYHRSVGDANTPLAMTKDRAVCAIRWPSIPITAHCLFPSFWYTYVLMLY
jgi:hypothetical protein